MHLAGATDSPILIHCGSIESVRTSLIHMQLDLSGDGDECDKRIMLLGCKCVVFVESGPPILRTAADPDQKAKKKWQINPIIFIK